MACGGALRAGFTAHGVKADFTKPDQLLALAAEPESPRRLVLLVGNTLGAFDPLAQARELRRMLRPGDALLVDGELYAGDATLAGYDNPLNRRFAWAPLHGGGSGGRGTRHRAGRVVCGRRRRDAGAARPEWIG